MNRRFLTLEATLRAWSALTMLTLFGVATPAFADPPHDRDHGRDDDRREAGPRPSTGPVRPGDDDRDDRDRDDHDRYDRDASIRDGRYDRDRYDPSRYSGYSRPDDRYARDARGHHVHHWDPRWDATTVRWSPRWEDPIRYRVAFAPAPPSHAIPPPYLPPPGLCRVWVPSLPPAYQQPPTSCTYAWASAPAGSWVVHSPWEQRGTLQVWTASPYRPGYFVGVGVYDAWRGGLLGWRSL